MNKKAGTLLSSLVVAGTYVYLLGLGLLRAFRHEPGAKAWATGPGAAHLNALADHREPLPPAPPPKKTKLQSLSLKEPGDAPLDRLARTALAERWDVPDRNENLGQPQRESTVDEVLQSQALASAPLPGWSEPQPEKLPVPTFTPAVMAFGIVIFAMGLATIWYVCLAGSLVFAVAAWRWVGELQGE